MSVFAPWVPMCGPLWASGLLTITERYKRGYKTMRTYWGGVCTFRASTVIAVMILPLVTLIKPGVRHLLRHHDGGPVLRLRQHRHAYGHHRQRARHRLRHRPRR